jgi:hypothetical protein
VQRSWAFQLASGKPTLDDVLADIKANREAAKQAVIRNRYRRELDEADLDTKLDLLRHDAWFGQPLLRRLMRRQWKRGKTSVDNQIVLDTQCYRVRKDATGRIWLDVISPRRTSGWRSRSRPTFRSLARCGSSCGGATRMAPDAGVPPAVTSSKSIMPCRRRRACVTRPCGLRAIGADKGYSEVFTDNDGKRHGTELGTMLSAMTDKNTVRYAGRQTPAALADNTSSKARPLPQVRTHRATQSEQTENRAAENMPSRRNSHQGLHRRACRDR